MSQDTSITKLTDRDTQRVCELLARFSMYTQQFEQENTDHDNQQTEKTETLGTVQERVSNTGTQNRRAGRKLPKAINKTTKEQKHTIVSKADARRDRRSHEKRLAS